MVFLGFIQPEANQNKWLQSNAKWLYNERVDKILNSLSDETVVIPPEYKAVNAPVGKTADLINLRSFPALGAPAMIPMLGAPTLNPALMGNIENTVKNPLLINSTINELEETEEAEEKPLLLGAPQLTENEEIYKKILNFGKDKSKKAGDWKSLLLTLDNKKLIILSEGGKPLTNNKQNREKSEYIILSLGALQKNPQLYINKLKEINGKGVKLFGRAKTNGIQNFGKYFLSMEAFKKGNLLIYRPQTNTILVSYKNMSPTLTKIVQSIRGSSPHSFELEDYNKLINSEKKAVEHIITLLRMDVPDKMERVIADENFDLKNRYEILVGELSAGNNSKILLKEIEDILKKMFTNKLISHGKHADLKRTIKSLYN